MPNDQDDSQSPTVPAPGALRPALVAEFGGRALHSTDLDSLLQEAAEAAAEGMGIRRAKVLRYRSEANDLLVQAGVGWNPGVVGSATLSTGMRSPPGRAWQTGEPVAIADLQDQDEFEHSRLLQDHGVVSLLNVPVSVEDTRWGVLEVDAETAGRFSEEHIHFLQGLANMLGAAIQLQAGRQELAATLHDLERRVAERTRQLSESNHRLRHEISERERAEAELRRREAEYRTLYNNAPAPQHSLDAEGRIVGVSDEWLRLLDYSREDVLGQPLEAFLTGDSARQFRANWPAFLAHGEERGLELQLRKRSGEIIDALVSRRVEHAADGTVRRTLGALTDITAWRKAERQRDRLFEISQDLIAILGFDGQFRDINPGLETVLGYRLDELQGRSYASFVHPDDVAKLNETIARLRRGEDPSRVELRYRRRDGAWRWTSWRATAVRDEGLIYALGRDITERRETEEALLQAQKMEAVGHLTGGVAHDFNNLLTVLIGNLELMRTRLPDEPRLVRMVEAMRHAVDRGERLTSQLLAFSRRQKLQPEVLDLNRLIRDFEPLIRRAVGEAVRLELQLANGLWPCRIDGAQLEAALLNLAVNARDAMPDGGILTIVTQNREQDPRLPQRVTDAAAGPYVAVAISDTGTGMPPEVIARVFEPFFTTKEIGKGTGLGLSQVYGFVKQSGGHVMIDSTPGQGTEVRLYLPPAGSGAVAPRAPHSIAAPRPGSERVLLVEDNPDVLLTVEALLSELGYTVRSAEGPLQALALLRSPEQRFDLLFSDVVMPDMTGVELAEAAQKLRPGLKVLLTSGHSREETAQAAAARGIPIIAKPYRHADLAMRMRTVLDAE